MRSQCRSIYVRLRERRLAVLFSLCELPLHTIIVEEAEEDESQPQPETEVLANIKIVLLNDDTWGGLRVLHFKNPSTTDPLCACPLWMRTQDISRVVFSIRCLSWGLGEYVSELPESWDSLVIIFWGAMYVPDAVDRDQCFADHWSNFCEIVRTAWLRGKTVTVVNAVDLGNLLEDFWLLSLRLDDPHRSLDDKPEDCIRRMAIRAVCGDINDHSNHSLQPGPVCPVHFVNLTEYRAQLAEVEYTIDTGIL